MAVTEITMDHLAVASDHAWDQLIRYSYHVGARWMGGPANDPDSEAGDQFYFCQVEFDGGTKIEILEAIEGEGSDFIRRFLDRNGPGPHHYTFKVPDIHEAIAAAESAGYDIVGARLDDPKWQEAFLHPKQSHGIVIQLAHNGEEGEGWIDATPLPLSPQSRPATLECCVHLVADLTSATRLFSDVLRMVEADRGRDDMGEFVELTSGPWRLRLVQPSDSKTKHWLGDRAGRLHHVSLVLDEPGTIPDARPIGGGRYEVPPEHNLGVRLILRQRQ